VLHGVHRSQNRKAKLWVSAEIAGIAVILALVPWNWLQSEISTLCLIAAYGFGTLFLSLGQLVFLRKHEISAEGHATLGQYNEQDLRHMIEGIRSQLGLGTTNLRVFATRDKDLNAMAVKIGASRLLPWLNGVYINRSLLHLLKPDELRAIIGHEFGHLTDFRSHSRDFLLIHALFALIVGVTVFYFGSLRFGLGEFFPVLLALGALTGIFSLSNSQGSGQVEEYLCDEYGARVGGVPPAVSALFKIGAASEIQLMLQARALEVAKAGGKLDPRQALEVYEEVLPFGNPDLEAVSAELDRTIHEKQRSAGALSIKGFLSYISDDEFDEDATEAATRHMKALIRAPRIDSRDLREQSKDRTLTAGEIEVLVDRLIENPSHLLFASACEQDEASTHPAMWRRILYLWRNREIIESGV